MSKSNDIHDCIIEAVDEYKKTNSSQAKLRELLLKYIEKMMEIQLVKLSVENNGYPNYYITDKDYENLKDHFCKKYMSFSKK